MRSRLLRAAFVDRSAPEETEAVAAEGLAKRDRADRHGGTEQRGASSGEPALLYARDEWPRNRHAFAFPINIISIALAYTRHREDERVCRIGREPAANCFGRWADLTRQRHRTRVGQLDLDVL